MRAFFLWVAPLVAVLEFPRKFIAEGIKSEQVPKGILKKAKESKGIGGDEAPKGILKKAKGSKARKLTFADKKAVRMYETKESEDFFKNHKHSEESEQALNNQEEEANVDLETLDWEYPEKGEEYEEQMAEIDARLAAIREQKRKIKEWEQETPDFENEVLGTVEIGYGEKVPKQMPSESEDDLEAEPPAPQSEGGAKAKTEGEEAPSKAKGIVLMRQAKAVKDQFNGGELDIDTAARKIHELFKRWMKLFSGVSRKKLTKVWNSRVMSDTRAAKDILKHAKGLVRKAVCGEIPFEVVQEFLGDLEKEWEESCKIDKIGEEDERVNEFKKAVAILKDEKKFGPVKEVLSQDERLEAGTAVLREARSLWVEADDPKSVEDELNKLWEQYEQLFKGVTSAERLHEVWDTSVKAWSEKVEKVLDDLEALMTEVAAGKKTPEEVRHSMEKLEAAWQTVCENYEVDPEDLDWFEKASSSLKEGAEQVEEVDQILDSLEALLDEASTGRKTMEEARPSLEKLEATWQKVRENRKVDAQQAEFIDTSFSILQDERQYVLKGTRPPSSPAERVLEPSTAGRALRGDQEHRT